MGSSDSDGSSGETSEVIIKILFLNLHGDKGIRLITIYKLYIYFVWGFSHLYGICNKKANNKNNLTEMSKEHKCGIKKNSFEYRKMHLSLLISHKNAN